MPRRFFVFFPNKTKSGGAMPPFFEKNFYFDIGESCRIKQPKHGSF